MEETIYSIDGRIIPTINGGAGSGNFGHAGRPGKKGGSASKGGSRASMNREELIAFKQKADERRDAELRSEQVQKDLANDKKRAEREKTQDLKDLADIEDDIDSLVAKAEEVKTLAESQDEIERGTGKAVLEDVRKKANILAYELAVAKAQYEAGRRLLLSEAKDGYELKHPNNESFKKYKSIEEAEQAKMGWADGMKTSERIQKAEIKEHPDGSYSATEKQSGVNLSRRNLSKAQTQAYIDGFNAANDRISHEHEQIKKTLRNI